MGSRKLPPEVVDFVVDSWIGVEQGELLEFTHKSLTEFFRRYCQLPDSHPGVLRETEPLGGYVKTKRERFIDALEGASSSQQATILRGVLKKLPVDLSKNRTQADADNRIRAWINRLEAVSNPVDVTSVPPSLPEVARKALDAARAHRDRGEFSQATDRIHTALHACAKQLLQEIDIDNGQSKKLVDSFGFIRERHPAFQIAKGDRAAADILKGCARIVAGLNAARNENSLAHPTDALLDDPEARLYCNAGMTLLQYIVDRVKIYEGRAQQDSGDLPFE